MIDINRIFKVKREEIIPFFKEDRAKIPSPEELQIKYEDNIKTKLRERYSLESEIALINNYNIYLKEGKPLNYGEEYEEYLAYREEIKKICKEELESDLLFFQRLRSE